MANKEFKTDVSVIDKCIDDYKRFKEGNTNRHRLSNKMLYELCKDHIGHDKEEEIEAKLLLIGRTYAASIERRDKKKTEACNDGDFIYDHIMKLFISKNKKTNLAKELDLAITQLNENRGFNKTNIDKLLRIHKKLINETKSKTQNEKRSFYSKYLHFHCADSAYMYDSRANAAITKFVCSQKYVIFENGEHLDYNDEYDKEYFSFLARLAILKKKLVNWSPREIDDFLLWYADNVLKKHV